MATIVKRPKRDGSFSYLARIRIARTGQPDYSESKTLPGKAVAEEWVKRRELALAVPGACLLMAHISEEARPGGPWMKGDVLVVDKARSSG